MIRSNQKMLQILHDLVLARASFLDASLQEILKGGIKKENDCYFLAKLQTGALNDVSAFHDHTGLECFVNKISIKEKDATKLKEQGFLYAHLLQELLEPHGIFNIILDIGKTDFDNKPNNLVCNIRFHKIREGEFWLKSDLETYDENALLVITTSNYKKH